MRLLLTFLLLFSVVPMTFSQYQNNNWIFGFWTNFNFSNGSNLNVQTVDFSFSANEGSSCISNRSTGNLLMYTNGVSVWNAQEDIMPNGTGLLGDMSTTQSALVVRQPQSDSIFYIFTAEEMLISPAGGAHYSIVNLSLDGGLGDVTLKNQELLPCSMEQIAGTLHANGEDVWILFHDCSTDEYISYLLTATGLTGPFVQTIGTNSTLYYGGVMHFSVDGTKLVRVRGGGSVELFHFDTNTGLLSDHIDGFHPSSWQFYGADFSTSGEVLYLTSLSPVNQLFQLDLSVWDSTAIMSSSLSYDMSSDGWMGAIRLAPNEKMYFCEIQDTMSISVIQNPDVMGSGCNIDRLMIELLQSSYSNGLCNYVSTGYSLLGNHEPPEDNEWITLISDQAINVLKLNNTNVDLLQIYNTSGILVEEYAGTSEIILRNIPPGIYYAVGTGDKARYTKQIWLK
jgi:hypothetical protein